MCVLLWWVPQEPDFPPGTSPPDSQLQDSGKKPDKIWQQKRTVLAFCSECLLHSYSSCVTPPPPPRRFTGVQSRGLQSTVCYHLMLTGKYSQFPWLPPLSFEKYLHNNWFDFWDKVLQIAQAGLEPVIFLPPSPRCWDDRHYHMPGFPFLFKVNLYRRVQSRRNILEKIPNGVSGSHFSNGRNENNGNFILYVNCTLCYH